MRTTARPLPASSLTSAWISALAPTSMPRVGSSRMSSRGRRGEHAGQQDLLLVAARELGELLVGPEVLMRSRSMSSSAMRRSSVPMRRPRRASRGRIVERDVVLHREGGDDALGLAVLGDEGDAGRDGRARGAAPDLVALDRDRAGIERLRAEDRLGRGGAPGAQQAGQADHLAPVDRHVDVLDDVAPGEALGLRARPPRRRAARVVREARDAVEASAISRPSISAMSATRSSSSSGPSWTRRPSRRTVTRVAETEDLVEPMGDVDDAPRPRRAAGR